MANAYVPMTMQGKSSAQIENRPFLSDSDLDNKTRKFAYEASLRSGNSMIQSTAEAGNVIVERCVNLHNSQHRGETGLDVNYYKKMVEEMVVEGEQKSLSIILDLNVICLSKQLVLFHKMEPH